MVIIKCNVSSECAAPRQLIRNVNSEPTAAVAAAGAAGADAGLRGAGQRRRRPPGRTPGLEADRPPGLRCR